MSYTSDSSKRLVLTGRYKWGDFYSGKRDEITAGVTFRPNAHLLFDFSDSFNSVRLPQGDFTTNLFAGRLNYNFSRKLLTSALMQLNSAARLSAINIRLRYIYRPNSDLFVIYTNQRELDWNGLRIVYKSSSRAISRFSLSTTRWVTVEGTNTPGLHLPTWTEKLSRATRRGLSRLLYFLYFLQRLLLLSPLR